jgi:hypothetical protein
MGVFASGAQMLNAECQMPPAEAHRLLTKSSFYRLLRRRETNRFSTLEPFFRIEKSGWNGLKGLCTPWYTAVQKSRGCSVFNGSQPVGIPDELHARRTGLIAEGNINGT